MQPIKIESIAQDEKKITFIQGKLKFGFWRTKQDGSETKAFAQFKKYGFQVGDTVQAEVKEEPATFTDEKGKKVNFTRRTVLYFQEVENTPVVSKSLPEAQNSTENHTLESLHLRIKALEDAKEAELY